jgi:oxygen-independent coproporphyrinogen III oxidase
MSELSLYIHVPFCVKKCAYCDFNAYSGLGALVDDYTACVTQEIAEAPERGRSIPTVFFGGGTPTFLPAGHLAALLSALRDAFALAPDAEITAEANPSTVDAAKFAAMREAGFNRLSIGVQAFDDRLLRAVDREHSAHEAAGAVAAARQAGFENVSVDLMFGLPTQTRADWDATLNRALALETEHLSLYALTLEPGTRFERLQAGGKLTLPDEDTELWMYERAIVRLTAAGYTHYEVSNFARGRDHYARHNLVYWRNEEYLGFGPGAVSYVGGRRWTKEKYPPRYIAKVRAGNDLTVESECLEPDAALAETLMLGLRLREGVALSRLQARFGVDPAARFAAPIARLRAKGMLEQEGNRLRLTHHGLLFANDASLELLP